MNPKKKKKKNLNGEKPRKRKGILLTDEFKRVGVFKTASLVQ